MLCKLIFLKIYENLLEYILVFLIINLTVNWLKKIIIILSNLKVRSIVFKNFKGSNCNLPNYNLILENKRGGIRLDAGSFLVVTPLFPLFVLPIFIPFIHLLPVSSVSLPFNSPPLASRLEIVPPPQTQSNPEVVLFQFSIWFSQNL